MKYKKYLTMFLAGTMVLGSVPAAMAETGIASAVESSNEPSSEGESGTTEEAAGEGENSTTEETTGESESTDGEGDLSEDKDNSSNEDIEESENGTTDENENGKTEENEGNGETNEAVKPEENIPEVIVSEETDETIEVPQFNAINLNQAAEPMVLSLANDIPDIDTTGGNTVFINNAEVQVTLTASSEESVIYYTTDGSDPTTSSTRTEYTEPFTLKTYRKSGETITVKYVAAKALDDGSYKYSAVVSQGITFLSNSELSFGSTQVKYRKTKTGNPLSIPKAGFDNRKAVTIAVYDNMADGTWIKDADTTMTFTEYGATVYYTTDGSDPADETNPNRKEATEDYMKNNVPYRLINMTAPDTDSSATIRFRAVEAYVSNGETIYSENQLDTNLIWKAKTTLTAPTLSVTVDGEPFTTGYIPNGKTAVVKVTNPNENCKILYVTDAYSSPLTEGKELVGDTIEVKQEGDEVGKYKYGCVRAVAVSADGSANKSTEARVNFEFAPESTNVDSELENGEYRAEINVSNDGVRYGDTTAAFKNYRLVQKNVYLEKTDNGIVLKTPVNVTGGASGIYLVSDTKKENNLLGSEVLYSEINNNNEQQDYKMLTLPVTSLSDVIHIVDDSGSKELYIKLSATPVKPESYNIDNALDNAFSEIKADTGTKTPDGTYLQSPKGSTILRYSVNHGATAFSNGIAQVYATVDGSDITDENESKTKHNKIMSPIINTGNISVLHMDDDYIKDNNYEFAPYELNLPPVYEKKDVTFKLRALFNYWDWETNSVKHIWTNQSEMTLSYEARGLDYVEDEATGVRFTCEDYLDSQNTIPYDSVFKVNEVTDDSEKQKLLNKVNESGTDTGAMYALNISLKDSEGNEVKQLGLPAGHNYWYYNTSGNRAYQLRVPARDGFNNNYMKIYKINEDGTVQRLAQYNEGSADGLSIVSVDTNDMAVSGTYVYIQDEGISKNLKNGNYDVTTTFTDMLKKPLATETGYIDGKAFLNVANGERTLYLPLTTADGKYVSSVKVYDASTGGYNEAEFKDVYTVDGKEYAKIAVCRLDKTSSYTKAKITVGGEEKEVYITLDLNKSSVSSNTIKTTTPEVKTETGKEVFRNEETVNVIINSYGKDSEVYYTTDGTEPSKTNGTKLEGNNVSLTTENKDGETITLKAVAYTEDYGMSDISSIKITFVKEGMAVEAVKKPKIVFDGYYDGMDNQLVLAHIEAGDDTEGVKLYYTTDGSTPTEESDVADGSTMYVWLNGMDGSAAGPKTIKVLAVADGYLPSEIAERTFTSDMDWWQQLNDGEYKGVKLRLRNYTVPTSLSMGNSALSGEGTLVVDGNDRYMWVGFKAMSLGGMPAYLRHMWYFDNRENADASQTSKNNTDEQNLWHEGEYKKELSSIEGDEISEAKIKLYGTDTPLDEQVIAIESNFVPMGIQKALLDIDYSALSGNTKEDEVSSPDVEVELNDDKTNATVTITADEGADIYYVVSDYNGEDTAVTPEQTEENKYSNSFVIEKTSNIKTVNAIAVKNGKTSLVATQKVIFEEESSEVKDGEYTADIAILNENTDTDSMAKDYFTTTAAPVTVKDGKYSVKLIYSTPLITALAQKNGDNFDNLEIKEENGKKYVVVSLGSADEAQVVQMTVNMGGRVSSQNFRVVLDKSTLKPVEEAQEKTYSVPVRMVQAANPAVESMGNAALDGNATVTVKDGKSYIDLKFKAVTYSGLYGHLLKLWGYPENNTSFDAKWWDKNEVPATVLETFNDYGMNYTLGDTTKSEFGRKFRMERNSEKEDIVYIRISVDAMAGFDQPARLEFDWDNATEIETEDKNIISAPTVTPEKEEANANETVKVVIGSATEGADIYYTTDGSIPTEKSTKYTEGFTVTGNGETVTINAIAVKDGKTSTVGSSTVKFAKAGSSGGSETDSIEDGKYWMEFNLWNANVDQASMGNVAFENNRKALVTISGGKATVEVATNPVSVSGYTSALKDLKSNSIDITVLDRDDFTTNTKFDGKEHSFDYIKRFSFTVDDLDTEYIDVKVSTPYTPMDGISANVGGWIDARFKLNFASLEKADSNASLIPNGSTASGSASGGGGAVSKKDEATGIKIEADEFVFEDGTEFESKEVTSGSSYNSAKAALGTSNPDFKLYDISAKYEGTKVEPAGQADIYIPVIEGVGKDGIKIFRITEGSSPSKAEKTELEFTLSSDGKYYVVKVKELGLFAIAYDKTVAPDTPVEEVKPEETVDTTTNTSFADVENHWAKEYIKKAVEKGLFKGVSENEFAPDTATTRGMLITVLGRMDNVSAGQFKTDKFTDVKEDDYFAPFVAWGVSNGIVSGMSENEFAPNDNITREQLAVMLYNYAKFKGIELGGDKEVSFADGEAVSDWAKEAVDALSKAGVMSGRDNGNFDPKANATRAEAATMLVNFVDSYMAKQAEETVTEEA